MGLDDLKMESHAYVHPRHEAPERSKGESGGGTVLVCCDTCRETLDVAAYEDDPPQSGWTRQKPKLAPGLHAWRCPLCQKSAAPPTRPVPAKVRVASRR